MNLSLSPGRGGDGPDVPVASLSAVSSSRSRHRCCRGRTSPSLPEASADPDSCRLDAASASAGAGGHPELPDSAPRRQSAAVININGRINK